MGQKESGGRKFSELLSKSKNWVLIFILFLAILGVYYQSLHHEFINFDDPYYINNNSYIRDPSWKGIYKIFSEPIVGNYFPLQILSYALDYQIGHIQPFGYHLHNLLLHLLNAILVFLLLKRIFSNTWISFLSALLFGLHPVNVESVTWVAERKNVLSLAFTLLSFLAYLYYLEEQRLLQRRGWYLAALFLFILALLSKVAAVVLPFLLILYDFCFHRKGKWEMVRDKIPFFTLSLFFSLITIWVYHTSSDLPPFHGGSPYTNILAMINVFVEYIIYLIVPVYLDNYYRTGIPQTIFEPQVLLSLGAIFLLALLAWRSFRKDRIFLFWFGWFFISLLPVLNIVPIAILRADRYMYLSAIGFFYLISLNLAKIGQARYRSLRLPAILFGALLVAGSYAFLSIERNKVWKDPVTLWEDHLRKFPHTAFAYGSIAYVYTGRDKPNLAISYFKSGLRENPNEVSLLNGLSTAYKKKGDLKKAEDLLLEASRLNPKDDITYNNLGAIYWQEQEIEKAKKFFQKSLEMNPTNSAAHTNLGAIYFNEERWDEAIAEWEKTIKVAPGTMAAYLNLSWAYKKRGLLDTAEDYLKKGLDYHPLSHEGLLLLGQLYLERGNLPAANFYLKEAHRLKPNDQNTNYSLGLMAQQEANHYFAKALKTTPLAQAKVIESGIDKSQRGRIQ